MPRLYSKNLSLKTIEAVLRHAEAYGITDEKDIEIIRAIWAEYGKVSFPGRTKNGSDVIVSVNCG